MFRPELVEADADDDEATEDMSIYRRKDDDDVSNISLDSRTPSFCMRCLPIMLHYLALYRYLSPWKIAVHHD